MLFDLEARFYKKQTDKEPRYYVPMGMFSPTSMDWFEKNGFKEDPESTPGYIDFIKMNVEQKDLEGLTEDSYDSEMLDVLFDGEEAERIDIVAMEIEPMDDKGTIPPKVLVRNDISVMFQGTRYNDFVKFRDGNYFKSKWNSKRAKSIHLGELKRHFGVITQYEVRMKLRQMSEDHWSSFDALKKWIEGIQEEEGIILDK